jgi:hypothetical protein
MATSKKRPLSERELSSEENHARKSRAKSECSVLDSSLISEDSLNSTRISTTESLREEKDVGQNVRVVARVRPLSAKELKEQAGEAIRVNAQSSTIVLDKNRTFEYDAVFDPTLSQREVYERTAGDTVKSNIFKGFNVTILAYGQTGSGKTFTMGTSGGDQAVNQEKCAEQEKDDEKMEPSIVPPGEGDGIIPRAVFDLFLTRNQMKKGTERVKVEMSYLEIYNEEARDLLCTDPSKQNTLHIRDSKTDGVYVQNLSWEEVSSPDQVAERMESAASRRATASTHMNAVSSRSHAICTLRVTIAPLTDIDDDDEDGSEEIRAKLTLVDLAGSERIKRTGAEGSRLKEGININKGLFVLGQVVASLSEIGQQGQDVGNHLHVPYRDSKLTRLLQDSLGGNSRTIMVACISPADSNVEESINTMRYAQRARNIKNSAVRNTVASALSVVEITALRRENQMLKLQVLQLQTRLDIGHASSQVPGEPSETTMIASCSESSEGIACNNIAGLNVSKLEILTKFRAKCAWQDSRIEQLESECRSGAKDALTASLKADRAQVQLEELLALTKMQNLNLPSQFISNTEKRDLVQQLRNEVSDLKSQLYQSRSDAAVTLAMAAAIVAGDGNLSTVEELALLEQNTDSIGPENTEKDDDRKLAAELVAVSGGIEQKEAMAEKLMKERDLQESMRSHFEGALNSLQQEVESLTAELQTIQGKVSKKRNATDVEPEDKVRARIRGLESRINELNDKAVEHKKSLRRADEAEKKCAKLAEEIQVDKKLRATLQRKLKEESEERRSEKKTAQLQAARMLRDSQKLKLELQKVKDAAARQATVLKRKSAEAVCRQKKIAEQQRKRNLASSMRSQLSSSNIGREDLLAWLDREIEASLERLHTKDQIEEQKALLEDAIEKRNELISASAIDTASGRALESEIDVRTSIINQLESNRNDYHQMFPASSGSSSTESHQFQEAAIWNSLSRSDLKALFPIAFETIATLKCEMAKIQSRHSEVLAKACGRAVVDEKRRGEEQLMQLKLENLETMSSLLETTKAAVEHKVRGLSVSDTVANPSTQSAVDIDEILNTYLDGCNIVGAKVKEDLADIMSRQEGMEKLVNNMAHELIARNEKNANSKKNRKQGGQKANNVREHVEETFDELAFEEVENEVVDPSDDSDWSPDTPARKKLKSNPLEECKQKTMPVVPPPSKDASSDAKKFG